MTFESDGGMLVPERPRIPHYHGDKVRALFILGAIVLVVAQSTGATLPLSTTGAVAIAVVLVVAAGITNPALDWIHWLDIGLAVAGTLLFGTAALERYREGFTVFDPSFVYVECLALVSLIALYFATRTVRGLLLRRTLP